MNPDHETAVRDDPVEHLYECPECGLVWMQPAPEEKTACPDCGATTASFIGEYNVHQGAGLYDGAASLREMIDRLDAERDRLEKFRLNGWTLEEPVEDDTAYLFRPPSNS